MPKLESKSQSSAVQVTDSVDNSQSDIDDALQVARDLETLIASFAESTMSPATAAERYSRILGGEKGLLSPDQRLENIEMKFAMGLTIQQVKSDAAAIVKKVQLESAMAEKEALAQKANAEITKLNLDENRLKMPHDIYTREISTQQTILQSAKKGAHTDLLMLIEHQRSHPRIFGIFKNDVPAHRHDSGMGGYQTGGTRPPTDYARY